MAKDISTKLTITVDDAQLKKLDKTISSLSKESSKLEKEMSTAGKSTLASLAAQKKIVDEKLKAHKEISKLLTKEGSLSTAEKTALANQYKELKRINAEEATRAAIANQRIKSVAKVAGIELSGVKKNTEAYKKFQEQVTKVKAANPSLKLNEARKVAAALTSPDRPLPAQTRLDAVTAQLEAVKAVKPGATDLIEKLTLEQSAIQKEINAAKVAEYQDALTKQAAIDAIKDKEIDFANDSIEVIKAKQQYQKDQEAERVKQAAALKKYNDQIEKAARDEAIDASAATTEKAQETANERRDFWRKNPLNFGTIARRPLDQFIAKNTNIITESDREVASNNKLFAENEKRIGDLKAKKGPSGTGLTDAETKELAKLSADNAGITTKNASLNAASGKASGTLMALNAAQVIGNTAVKMAQGINSAIKSTLGFSLSIKDTFSDILSSVGEMLNQTTGMATYGIGSSLITNATARESQMKYGLSDSQNYAMTQAMSMLGMKSDNDLLYMNQNQQAVFKQFMDKYASWYDDLSSSGVLDSIQQMQLDFSMFKQELAVDFLKWIAENKGTIMAILKGVMDGIKWMVELLGKILTAFGVDYADNSFGSYSPGLATAVASDTAGANIWNGNTNNIKIDMSANATGVLSSQEHLEKFFKEQMEKWSAETITAME